MKGTHEALVGVVILGAALLTTVGTLWLQGVRFGAERSSRVGIWSVFSSTSRSLS